MIQFENFISDDKNCTNKDPKQIQAKVKKLLDELDSAKDRPEKTAFLDTLSPWLAQYHWHGGDNDFIELPGQFTGNVEPNDKNTLKIVKFHEMVSIFHSLRCPIRISCTCSNGKSYSFLVKYGEDLRQGNLNF